MKPTKGFPSILFKLMNTKTTSGKGTRCDKGYGDVFGDENFKLFPETLPTTWDGPRRLEICLVKW